MADPFAWLNYKVTSPFGDTDRVGGLRTKDSDHIDIGTPEGVPITSLNDGVVLETGNHPQFGNYVIVKKDDGNTARYFHGSAVNVKRGQRVSRGDVVMTSGNTGASTGPHTSVTVFNPAGQPFDPLEYIRKLADSFGGTTMATGTKSPGSRGPTSRGLRDDPEPKPSRPGAPSPGTRGDTTTLGRLMQSGIGLQGQSGGTTPLAQAFQDPTVGASFWDDPGLFFGALGDESPLLAVARAMSRGGAPVFGGPDYMGQIAGFLTSLAQISTMLNPAGGPGGFGGAVGQLGGSQTSPTNVMDMISRLVNASQGGSALDQLGAAGGSSAGAGGVPTSPEMQAAAGQLEGEYDQYAGTEGARIGNIFDLILNDPQNLQYIMNAMTFGSGAGGNALRKYMSGVVQPAQTAFQRENYAAGITNPLLLLRQLAGGF